MITHPCIHNQRHVHTDARIQTYMQTCTNIFIHSYTTGRIHRLLLFKQRRLLLKRHTYIHACMHACIHYKYTGCFCSNKGGGCRKDIHTHIHTCMHTYIHTLRIYRLLLFKQGRRLPKRSFPKNKVRLHKRTHICVCTCTLVTFFRRSCVYIYIYIYIQYIYIHTYIHTYVCICTNSILFCVYGYICVCACM